MSFHSYVMGLVGIPILIALLWGHDTYRSKEEKLARTLNRADRATKIQSPQNLLNSTRALKTKPQLSGRYCHSGVNIREWKLSKEGEASLKIYPDAKKEFHKYYPILLETSYSYKNNLPTIGYTRWAFRGINAFKYTLLPVFYNDNEKKVTAFVQEDMFFSQSQCPVGIAPMKKEES